LTITDHTTGTGKSVLLREIIKTLGDGPSSTLGITASTGIASVNIGGTTLHSWAGIGLGQEPVKTLAGKILGQSKLGNVRDRWKTAKTLIIDEGVHVQRNFVHSVHPES
jgi:ATP-dependent DNA helicase PIF1